MIVKDKLPYTNNMKREIVIYGCGGHARSIVNSLLRNNPAEKILLVDDNARDNESIMGVSCMKENGSQLSHFIVGIGDNTVRTRIYTEKINAGQVPVNVKAKSSNIAFNSQFGEGNFVAEFAYVGPEAKIGNNCILNTGSIIEHEVFVGDNVHVAPHATVCGRCNIGNNVFVGAGAIVIDKINVCDTAIIGAGAVVIHDIIESGVYVGNPARRIR